MILECATLAVALALAVALIRKARGLPQPGDCPSCGYDLTGNVSGTCPECGART